MFCFVNNNRSTKITRKLRWSDATAHFIYKVATRFTFCFISNNRNTQTITDQNGDAFGFMFYQQQSKPLRHKPTIAPRRFTVSVEEPANNKLLFNFSNKSTKGLFKQSHDRVTAYKNNWQLNLRFWIWNRWFDALLFCVVVAKFTHKEN